MVSIHQVLVELFIESFREVPEELIPDFDATDDRVHGNQAGRAWHGYCRSHCFLPLYVSCNDRLPVSCPRPGNADAAQQIQPAVTAARRPAGIAEQPGNPGARTEPAVLLAHQHHATVAGDGPTLETGFDPAASAS